MSPPLPPPPLLLGLCSQYVTQFGLLSHKDPVGHETEDPTRTAISRERSKPQFEAFEVGIALPFHSHKFKAYSAFSTQGGKGNFRET